MILQNQLSNSQLNFPIGFLSADWLIVKIQPISVQKANQNKQNGKPGCDDELRFIDWREKTLIWVDLTGEVYIYVKLYVVSLKLNTTFTVI